MTNYGNLLHKGLSVNRDDIAAVEWLEKGANHGDYYGAQVLADMYEHGDGVHADASKAQMWSAKSKQLKAQLDQAEAQEKKGDAQYQADRELVRGTAYGGANMLINEFARNPRCDIVSPYAEERRKQTEARDSAIAAGTLDCSYKSYLSEPAN